MCLRGAIIDQSYGEHRITSYNVCYTKLLRKLLSYHQAVRGVFYNDKRQVSRSFIDSAYQEIYSIDIQTLNHQLLKEDSVINKLEQYINNGYRKIQKLEINDEFASYYLYAIKTKDRQVKTAGLIIDKKAFVTA